MAAPEEAFRDVRMRGFARRTPVSDAWRWIDQHSTRCEATSVAIAEAAGQVLAADVTAPVDVPEFRRSAMDGYAVIAAETVGAGDYNPLRFQILGESMPGEAWSGKLLSGGAVRIMTGAPIPDGADAVVPAEFARLDGDFVELTSPIPAAKNIGQIGEDIRLGQTVLSAGRRLRPQDVGLLASLGFSEVEVIRRPRVRILVTGNELVPPGTPKGPFQIYEANSYMLRGLIDRDGGELESVCSLADDPSVIREALLAPGADVLLVSGGSSVGREDFAPVLIKELGELPIHGIAMRPASPAGMGSIEEKLVFLLPGNPVSCLCAYDFFAGRAIRQRAGRKAEWPYPSRKKRLTRKMVSEIGRCDYSRVQVNSEGVEPLALSGASILSSTTRADGFVVIPEESEGYPPGAEVELFLYDIL